MYTQCSTMGEKGKGHQPSTLFLYIDNPYSTMLNRIFPCTKTIRGVGRIMWVHGHMLVIKKYVRGKEKERKVLLYLRKLSSKPTLKTAVRKWAVVPNWLKGKLED